MKFDSSLDMYENIQRMQVRAFDDPAYLRVRWVDLLPDELATLRKLNATLLAIEQRYQAEAAQWNPALEARTARIKERGQGRFHEVNLAGGDVALSDFEVELQIVFYLKETDPEWEDDDDNLLWYQDVLLTFSRKSPEQTHGHASDLWDNGGPFPQCRLFRQLVDGPLHLRDILRIGSLWCDLVITEQRYVNLSEAT